jgi:glutamate N-acetyltransferase / amino-acid N-acetyltransferase
LQDETDKFLPVAGIELASVAVGIKKNGNQDLVIIEFDETASCVATFTQNAFCAAPVILAKTHLAQQHSTQLRALLINSGNANAGTGDTGMHNAEQCCQWLADELMCSRQQVLPFSTGVIGEQLPMSVIHSGIKLAVAQLKNDNWQAAANGIMTTDTVAKAISKTIQLDDKLVTISGIAKGSGMICPNMATMLAFVATDAAVDSNFLQACLSTATEDSFNAITVDGDTSTNDACVLIATGRAGNDRLQSDSAQAEIFMQALNEVCQFLAKAIVYDAEGATKFVTIEVEQAKTTAEARQVAYTIAHSPLVKTALFASDPNWGRILAAVGRAGVESLDISKVNIFLGDVCIVHGGGVDAAYTEARGQAVMDQKEITIIVELGRGEVSTRLWTSDLSHEYVRINSEYRS